MRITPKQLILANIVTFILFAAHFAINTSPCEAYYIHDDSIMIAPLKLILRAFILFVVAACIQLISERRKQNLNPRLFIGHYIISLLSTGLYALAINHPCESINGGHYMFIDGLSVAGSFVLRIAAYITLGVMTLKTFGNFREGQS